MAVTRSSGRLNAELTLTVRNDSNRLLHRELQVGRCTGGAAPALVCPASVRIPVRLPAHQQRRINRNFTLRQPPARTDSIQAALVRPATRQRSASIPTARCSCAATPEGFDVLSAELPWPAG